MPTAASATNGFLGRAMLAATATTGAATATTSATSPTRCQRSNGASSLGIDTGSWRSTALASDSAMNAQSTATAHAVPAAARAKPGVRPMGDRVMAIAAAAETSAGSTIVVNR